MYVNKLTIKGETVFDISKDTVAENTVFNGVTFHKANGKPGVGTLQVGKPVELSTEAEMDAALSEASEASVGTVYKYTGETTDRYENGAIYIIEEAE